MEHGRTNDQEIVASQGKHFNTNYVFVWDLDERKEAREKLFKTNYS